MKVFVVMYEDYENRNTFVLDVYTDEKEADKRQQEERQMIRQNPDTKFRDECWYTDHEVI